VRVDELAWPQPRFLIGEFGLEGNRPSILVDGVVDHLEDACGELPVVVTVKSLNGERVPSHCLSYAAQVTLGYGKSDINRLDLRDDDERRRRTGLHKVADVY
jgi:hypothetical protein